MPPRAPLRSARARSSTSTPLRMRRRPTKSRPGSPSWATSGIALRRGRDAARGVGENRRVVGAVVARELRGGGRARREDEIGGARRAAPQEDVQRRLEAPEADLGRLRPAEDLGAVAQRSHRAALLDVAHLQQGDEQRANLPQAEPEAEQPAVGLVELHDIGPEVADPAQGRQDDRQREEDLRSAGAVAAAPQHLDLVAARPQPCGELQHLLTDPGEIVRRQGVGDQQDAQGSKGSR